MLIPSSIVMPHGSGRNTSPLSQISGAQALFDLDATLSTSYSGAGANWANLIAAPDDGSGQSAYDFTLKVSPAFTGSAGDAAAYWAMGGSNYFEIAGGNTAMLGNIHKTAGGAPATMIIALRTPSSIAAANLLGTEASGGGGTGWSMRLQAATSLRNVHIVSGSGFNTGYTTAFSAGTDYLAAIAVDFTGGTVKFAVNARAFTGATLTHGTTTAAASHAFQIGAADTLAIVAGGTRIYGAYGFNKLLTDGQLSAVVDVLNSRHGRVYA
jgi:hypothetical protein